MRDLATVSKEYEVVCMKIGDLHLQVKKNKLLAQADANNELHTLLRIVTTLQNEAAQINEEIAKAKELGIVK
jgi:hypothetical protein